ncbi:MULTISPECIES: hypothetical protein [unclassified Kitasatospora]
MRGCSPRAAPQTVNAEVETLLAAQRNGDVVMVAAALQSSVLRELDQ